MERQKVNVMKKKFVSILLTVFMILLFVGCDLDGLDSHNNNETFEVTDINDLDQIEYFRSGALEHILEGELNKSGQAVGYHYDQLPTKKGEIIEGTETKPNEFGVYEAEVIVSDVKKNSNGGKSTFFPDEWDSQDVINAINEAYQSKKFINGNTFEGLTSDGVVIRMYLDNKEKIISAFPVH